MFVKSIIKIIIDYDKLQFVNMYVLIKITVTKINLNILFIILKPLQYSYVNN